MSKIKLTKTELKKQKESLKRFVQYLPTLQLKKQQLQKEVAKISQELEQLRAEQDYMREKVDEWVDVFNEDVGLEKYIKHMEVKIKEDNIAGIDIPVFDGVGFKGEEYDPEKVPLWVDYAVEAVEEMKTYNVRIKVLEKQLELVNEELRRTSQRVNLFEKVKIPETKENIRKIQIFMGDIRTAEVITGKIAKTKIQKKAEKAAS